MPIAQISIHPEPTNLRTFGTPGLSFSGCFRVMHRFSDFMSHSISMLSGKQLWQSHAPVNSCIVYTLGLPLAWLFLVLHPFIDLMNRVKVQCQSHEFPFIPSLPTHMRSVRGCHSRGAFSIQKNARQVTSVFELYFSVSGFYFFAFFSLPRPLRNLRKPPFLPLSISSIPASARSFISPIDQDAIAR